MLYGRGKVRCLYGLVGLGKMTGKQEDPSPSLE
jgi:hypothetical protein